MIVLSFRHDWAKEAVRSPCGRDVDGCCHSRKRLPAGGKGGQEVADRHRRDAVPDKRFLPPVRQDGLRFGVVLAERLEPPEIPGVAEALHGPARKQGGERQMASISTSDGKSMPFFTVEMEKSAIYGSP